MHDFGLPFAVLIFGTATLAAWERFFPGRALPQAKLWYLRAFFFNSLHVLVLVALGTLFDDFFRAHALFSLGRWNSPLLEGLALWFAGTFVFYWWHRSQHRFDWLWLGFHQMHHSPSRIETLTAFYKHPSETVAEVVLGGFVLYMLLGASPEAMAWYGTLIALSAFFSHANIRTPRWIGLFQQRPEQHSIHHQVDLHRHNYADLILWDRLFGTFKEAEDFAPKCGFHGENELRVGEMLICKDVYR